MLTTIGAAAAGTLLRPLKARAGSLPISPVAFAVKLNLARATVYLLGRAGARRIKVLECCGESTDPFAKFLADAGCDPSVILNAASNVEMENTKGPGKDGWSTIWCPDGSLVFPGYQINSAYTDCDVMVSIAKMKEHHYFGVTLSIKNCYGMTPLNI